MNTYVKIFFRKLGFFIYYLFIILIATFVPVSKCYACVTIANAPFPITFYIL